MGLRGGGVDATNAGGVIHPLRTASESKASASTGLLVSWGRNKFCNYPIPIGHQHRLAALGKADVFTELIFQDL